MQQVTTTVWDPRGLRFWNRPRSIGKLCLRCGWNSPKRPLTGSIHPSPHPASAMPARGSCVPTRRRLPSTRLPRAPLAGPRPPLIPLQPHHRPPLGGILPRPSVGSFTSVSRPSMGVASADPPTTSATTTTPRAKRRTTTSSLGAAAAASASNARKPRSRPARSSSAPAMGRKRSGPALPLAPPPSAAIGRRDGAGLPRPSPPPPTGQGGLGDGRRRAGGDLAHRRGTRSRRAARAGAAWRSEATTWRPTNAGEPPEEAGELPEEAGGRRGRAGC